MQAHVHVIGATILEEQVAVHMDLNQLERHLDVVTQFVHLEYTDVYHVIVQDVTDVKVMSTDII